MSHPPPPVLDQVKAIIAARGATHGEDAALQLAHAQGIKRAIQHHAANLDDAEKEAIDAIAVKLSRMVNGKPALEHWLDIIGYALIAAEMRQLLEVGAFLRSGAKP